LQWRAAAALQKKQHHIAVALILSGRCVGPSFAQVQPVPWRTNLKERVFSLSIAVLKLHPQLSRLGVPQAHIANQVFRSASAIGALLEEADVAVSRRDMALKQAIALREARESVYWLKLLIACQSCQAEVAPLLQEANEFVAMLTVSVKKLRADPTGPPDRTK
jgi:four helix bundle protein